MFTPAPRPASALPRGSRRAGALLVAAGLVLALTAAPAPAAPEPAPAWTARSSGPLAEAPRVFTTLATLPGGTTGLLYGGWAADDSDRGGVALADTWTYDDASGWVPRCGTAVAGATAACGPGPRALAGSGTAAGGTILFGGLDGPFEDGQPRADTWRWDGEGWVEVCDDAGCGPERRIMPAVAGNGSQVVLFGGYGATGRLDDTWTFDGTSWAKVCGGPAAPCGPPARSGGALAWDGRRFVLFGGSTGTGVLDDTWVFEDGGWSPVCGTGGKGEPCGPPPRELAGMTGWVTAGGAVEGALMVEGAFLFGEIDETEPFEQVLHRDAWRFAGRAWTRVEVAWPDTPLTWVGDDEAPPSPDAPVVGLVTARPAAGCSTLLFGVRSTGPVAFDADTRTYGWPPEVCAGGTPTTTTTTTTTAPPPTTPAPAVPAAADAGATRALARTGPGAPALQAGLGLGLVALGGCCALAGRSRSCVRARPIRRCS